MSELGFQIKATGPVFDGRAKVAAHSALLAAEERVAAVGEQDVRVVLGSVLRNPTGYYESRVSMHRVAETVVLDDSGVIYGAWLEGTSSRNQTTRFKGYATFRKVAQSLQKKANDIASSVFKSFEGKMN